MALTVSRTAYGFCTDKSLDEVCCGQKVTQNPSSTATRKKLCFPRFPELMFLCRGRRSRAEGVKPVPDPRLPSPPAQCAFLGLFEPSPLEEVMDGARSPLWAGAVAQGTTSTHVAEPTCVIVGFQNIPKAVSPKLIWEKQNFQNFLSVFAVSYLTGSVSVLVASFSGVQLNPWLHLQSSKSHQKVLKTRITKGGRIVSRKGHEESSGSAETGPAHFSCWFTSCPLPSHQLLVVTCALL